MPPKSDEDGDIDPVFKLKQFNRDNFKMPVFNSKNDEKSEPKRLRKAEPGVGETCSIL